LIRNQLICSRNLGIVHSIVPRKVFLPRLPFLPPLGSTNFLRWDQHGKEGEQDQLRPRKLTSSWRLFSVRMVNVVQVFRASLAEKEHVI
jgi:hypothetical protein